MKRWVLAAAAAAVMAATLPAGWAKDGAGAQRDEFFWLSEMNKATAVINTDEKLLDSAVAKNVAHGLQNVIDNGNKEGGARPTEVITATGNVCGY